MRQKQRLALQTGNMDPWLLPSSGLFPEGRIHGTESINIPVTSQVIFRLILGSLLKLSRKCWRSCLQDGGQGDDSQMLLSSAFLTSAEIVDSGLTEQVKCNEGKRGWCSSWGVGTPEAPWYGLSPFQKSCHPLLLSRSHFPNPLTISSSRTGLLADSGTDQVSPDPGP